MSNELGFGSYAGIVRKNWRLFAIVALIAIALSGVLSGPTFMKPRYKSTAVVYPVNLNSYSIETRTDQLLQLLQSNSIRDTLIKNFHLPELYEIDTTGNGGYFALYNEFNDRVDISKTLYESVQIEIVDENPRVARDMVLAMLKEVNLLARKLQREKSEEVLRIAERALNHERSKIDTVQAKMDRLRRDDGLLSYDAQVKELTKGYVRMISSGASQSQRDAMQKMINELQEKGGEFRELTELSDLFRKNYDRLLSDYERNVSDVTKELTYTNTIVYPEVADKKVYPVRWLVVSTSTLSALFLCFVLVVWRDQKR